MRRGSDSASLQRREDGIIGACGISGDTGERDEECAVAGITKMGMKADPGQD